MDTSFSEHRNILLNINFLDRLSMEHPVLTTASISVSTVYAALLDVIMSFRRMQR